ncbi:GTP--adenosylcobinamide-phosphate guanylyl transferase [Natronobacterium gregoryi]|uniref:GTP--adenosylcobinamide-phosphate guanylyl transferase n=2 Tax=Natronobacterium gregoryi TaxID=44930 RepID=L0AJ28_NATGS|nr:GTP--adenosylcobinamide-phosphate guanylyl transferase [Natronobacterium gregoryi]AFZ73908.1 GTP:adenosylcobinamide-phosphate guanylyltransferase [Natronobacterium gregoryi SP2]ELY71570.1 GTP:adenosylcobinamide-phosphate guanylyl transferase-like protein [Natronobacterium gregoryi SP2]PLK19051.1 GTP--adenosylcobinamide-phosphate guanylyl transferase [Natronobacterium gregoryi SP2]SFJ62903.1 adenosylcobinamide-phosphate guanylyltransferase [Natronobacterium gregoryi]
MCGGEGTRLESTREKPRYPIAGDAMVDRVVTALDGSAIETIYAAVSPNAPDTWSHLEETGRVQTIETAGDGYVADLLAVLDSSAVSPPILTVAADLPLLEGPVVDRILAVHGDDDGSRTVCVPVTLKRRLGVSVDSRLEPADHLAPTGVNVVGTEHDTMYVSYDSRLAVNVNRLEDAQIATELEENGCE